MACTVLKLAEAATWKTDSSCQLASESLHIIHMGNVPLSGAFVIGQEKQHDYHGFVFTMLRLFLRCTERSVVSSPRQTMNIPSNT